MYSLRGHGDMLADEVRRQAYLRALTAAIRPGDDVIEIGAGVGYFALAAAKLGAAAVWALEPGDVVAVARDIVTRNGLADRVHCVPTTVQAFLPPRQADVVFSDLRGVLPWFAGHLDAIADARERLLAPGGRLIPVRDEVWGTVVEAGETWERLVRGWRQDGVDLTPAREGVLQGWSRARLRPEAPLFPAVRWGEVDYRRCRGDDRVAGRIEGVATRDALAHGAAAWFDAELFEGIGFSNRPGAPATLYGQAFFPFLEALEVRAGDRVVVDITARPARADYLWRWTTRVDAAAPARRRRFDQSTFLGVPALPGRLAKRSAAYVARRNAEAELLRFVLERMDGRHSNEAIAAALVREFPERSGSPADALACVADVVARYGEERSPADPPTGRPDRNLRRREGTR